MSPADVRRVARSARRVVDGARGLGMTTTARWGAQLLPRHEPEAVNTSLTWVRVRPNLTTLVWIANYWSDAYGIASPEIEATLLDGRGAVVDTWSIELLPDATAVVDVRAIGRAQGRFEHFDGQLLLRITDDQLVAGRPVQVFAEYRRDDGECSGVHGQYGLLESPVAQVVSAMRVEAGPGVRTGFVITNAYAGPGAPHAMRTQLTVYSADGDAHRAVLPPVPAQGTLIAYADDAIPDLVAHLGGQVGHARVRLACPSSRIATFVESRHDGRLVVDHGTVDRTFDQESGIDPRWNASWPVASVVAIVGDGHDTVVTLPNVWGPRAADYVANLRVHALDGSLAAETDIAVPRDALREVAIGQLLASNTSGCFHVEVSVRPDLDGLERPHAFDVLVAMTSKGVRRAEAQVGSEFSNAAVPDGVRWPDIRRTRIFARVDETEGRRTHLFLAYPIAGPDPAPPTHPTVTLLSADGTRRATTSVELAPHGALHTTVGELFPDADTILGEDGFGHVRIRDTEARLYGYSWVEHPHAHTFPLDHLIGG